MKDKNIEEAKTRMIHIRLPKELHKKVRVRAAETDKTIQDWTVEVMRNEIERQAVD